MFIILFFGSAIIYGIIRSCVLPKPPKGLSRKELEYYYRGGWKEYREQQRIEEQQILLELEETKQRKLKLYHEIEFLTARIAMLDDLQLLIEKDIRNGIGNEKANLSRLISLDNQMHTAQQKIDKLNTILESL